MEDGDLSATSFALQPERVSWTAIPGAIRERLVKIAVSSQLKLGRPCVKSRNMNHVPL